MNKLDSLQNKLDMWQRICTMYGTNNLTLTPSDVVQLRQEVAVLYARIAELSQAVGLITTLKPTMVMDADHPLDMAKEVEAYVTARIAELEAERRWIPVDEPPTKSGKYNVLIKWKHGKTVDTGTYITKAGRLGNHWFNDNYIDGAYYVTHWMPLPALPEVTNESS